MRCPSGKKVYDSYAAALIGLDEALSPRSKRAQEIRDAWVAYYLRLAGVHQHLSEENRRKAARLAGERGG